MSVLYLSTIPALGRLNSSIVTIKEIVNSASDVTVLSRLAQGSWMDSSELEVKFASKCSVEEE